MRRSTALMLGTLAILAAIVWGALIAQELRRPRTITVPTHLATAPLTDSEEAGEYTITLLGRVVDADTRAEIPVAAVRIRIPPSTGAPGGVLDLAGPTFEAHIPANRVSTLTVVAPGYVALEQQVKPHYQRTPPSTWTSPWSRWTWASTAPSWTTSSPPSAAGHTASTPGLWPTPLASSWIRACR